MPIHDFHTRFEEDVEEIVRLRLSIEKAKELGFSEEETSKRLEGVKSTRLRIKRLQKWLSKKKTATNGGQADCQRIVSEEALPNMRAQGWRVSGVLPSGEVVVSNE